MLCEVECSLPTNVLQSRCQGQPPKFDIAFARQLLAALDQDGNGRLEKNEWCDWVLQGMQKSDEELQQIYASNGVGAKMASLVWCVRAYAA